jgi:hypothetical protein
MLSRPGALLLLTDTSQRRMNRHPAELSTSYLSETSSWAGITSVNDSLPVKCPPEAVPPGVDPLCSRDTPARKGSTMSISGTMHRITPVDASTVVPVEQLAKPVRGSSTGKRRPRSSVWIAPAKSPERSPSPSASPAPKPRPVMVASQCGVKVTKAFGPSAKKLSVSRCVNPTWAREVITCPASPTLACAEVWRAALAGSAEPVTLAVAASWATDAVSGVAVAAAGGDSWRVSCWLSSLRTDTSQETMAPACAVNVVPANAAATRGRNLNIRGTLLRIGRPEAMRNHGHGRQVERNCASNEPPCRLPGPPRSSGCVSRHPQRAGKCLARHAAPPATPAQTPRPARAGRPWRQRQGGLVGVALRSPS